MINKNNELKDDRIYIGIILIIVISFLTLFIIFTLLYVVSKNKLIKNLNKNLKAKNKELVIAKQKIELKALLNQINPHFIFNTLNSIQQFIILNDAISSLNYF